MKCPGCLTGAEMQATICDECGEHFVGHASPAVVEAAQHRQDSRYLDWVLEHCELTCDPPVRITTDTTDRVVWHISSRDDIAAAMEAEP